MRSLLLAVLLAYPFSVCADPDGMLQKIIDAYGIETCKQDDMSDEPMAKFGEALFSSKGLSGDKDISCATCHVESLAFADGLPLAIGVGGAGEGEDRLRNERGAIVARNAFTLFGRGHPAFATFFWDGKVDAENEKIFSPFGDELSAGFDGPLAVAAVLPLTERDEFIGELSELAPNDLQRAVKTALYQTRFEKLDEALRRRFLTDEDLAASLQAINRKPEKVTLVLLANALAAFIRSEFACAPSSWEAYLAGDTNALTREQKEGARVFFGSGRCAGCHTPPLFTDFRFYNLGIPQGSFGPHSRNRDLGRAGVTNQAEDRYLFRTPPLLAVARTAPYGHNGRFGTLDSIVGQHLSPVSPILRGEIELTPEDQYSFGKIVALMSDKLSYIEIRDDQDLAYLVEFLRAL